MAMKVTKLLRERIAIGFRKGASDAQVSGKRGSRVRFLALLRLAERDSASEPAHNKGVVFDSREKARIKKPLA